MKTISKKIKVSKVNGLKYKLFTKRFSNIHLKLSFNDYDGFW